MDPSTLTRLYDVDGPFVSIYLDTTSAVEDAAQRLETRWKNVLRELDTYSIDTDTVAALDAVRGDHVPGNTRVLIAARGQVLLTESLPAPPPRDLVKVGALPHLLPLLDTLSLRLPHLVVLTDRHGADVLAYTGTDALPAAERSVEADAWPIHKTGVGGWSSKRYDCTVQNSWEESAKEVADLVERVAGEVDPSVVVVSGDGRAVGLLTEHLPEGLRSLAVVVEGGGRARDGSDEVVADGVLRAVADAAGRETLALLGRFAEERGRERAAADGLAATVAALRMSQVGTLVLTDTFEGSQPMWFGPQPGQLALTRGELADLGVDDPVRADAVDVLVRAALGTAAEVRLVPADVEAAPRDGVGALLRFATAPGTVA